MTPETALSEHRENRTLSIMTRVACSETWSGIERAASPVELPGLAAFVHSVPFKAGDAGGDVHHLSICPDSIFCRIALADVNGQRQSVAAFGRKLRDLMQRYFGLLSPEELMQDLNLAVREELDNVHYATMVTIGWNSRRGLLGLQNAGHPVPLWYRASCREWNWLEIAHDSERRRTADVPLGLLADVDYGKSVVKVQPGDLVVLYSDGVSEAMNSHGHELGLHGLLKMATTLDCSSAKVFGVELLSALNDFRGGEVPRDDETVIVIRRGDR